MSSSEIAATVKTERSPQGVGQGAGHVAPPSVRRPPALSLLLEKGMLIGGKYQLIRPLGQGGMAEVWVALHVPLRTEVAVKFVSSALAGDLGQGQEAMERFRFEAQISARLGSRSRHVVMVHDADMHEGRPYLVMELVEGLDLDTLISTEGALPPERVAEVLEQVADALDAVHSFGVLHRDLKPSNVLLTKTDGGGTVAKVADFGVAKALGRDVSLDTPRATAMGTLVGSPAYMSPEQVRGDLDIDGRSDLWSLAVLAYEALTAKMPFMGNTAGIVMAQVVTGKYDPARDHRPELPPALDAWFKRALALDREQRFRSAKEMAVAFRAAIAPRQAPSKRPFPVLVALGVVGVGALLSVLIWIAARGSAGASEDPPPPAAAAAPPPVATAPPQVAPAPEPAPTPTGAPATTPAAAPATAPTTATAAPATAAPASSPTRTTTKRTKKIDPSEIQ